jgi:hypothetical protein
VANDVASDGATAVMDPRLVVIGAR